MGGRVGGGGGETQKGLRRAGRPCISLAGPGASSPGSAPAGASRSRKNKAGNSYKDAHFRCS